MNAADFAALARDLRAAGIRFEPDVSYPFLVRQQAALTLTFAIGSLCKRAACGSRERLMRRALDALRWIEAMGARSIWAKRGWFKRCSP